LKRLPNQATYYYCAAKLPRALPAKALQELGFANNLIGKTYASVKAALKAAKQAATPNDFIFVGGSTFTVAEAL
ncbi:MAG TPA: bifunctional folylpolyglutamate synthase/dihydrofolate synthase, partial [Bacteroidia bacterium]|nr:bifunctional folylpolyglutamate synthase/dihydrofolate synthase [Bacteroidia bacterium]